MGVINSEDFNDGSSSEEEIIEYEGKTKDGPQETILNLENEMKELRTMGWI